MPEGEDPVLALDAIGSYGYGFQVFFLGLPLHFEWAKRLDWKDIGRPFGLNSYRDDVAPVSGSDTTSENFQKKLESGLPEC